MIPNPTPHTDHLRDRLEHGDLEVGVSTTADWLRLLSPRDLAHLRSRISPTDRVLLMAALLRMEDPDDIPSVSHDELASRLGVICGVEDLRRQGMVDRYEAYLRSDRMPVVELSDQARQLRTVMTMRPL